MTNSARILLFSTLSFLAACSGGYEHKKSFGEFSNKVWEKGNVLTFQPKIEDSSSTYRLLLDLRHVYGFPSPQLHLRSTITSPSGKSREKEHRLRVMKKGKKGEKPEYLSSCSGDICDLTLTLYESLGFQEKGKYKIEVQQLNAEKLPNVMEVALMLDRNMKGEDVVIQKDAVQGR
jgi:gliding motility-associated lipoprotein GldH